MGSNIRAFIGGIIFIAIGISLLDSNIFLKIIGILMIVFSAFTIIYITKEWMLYFIIGLLILGGIILLFASGIGFEILELVILLFELCLFLWCIYLIISH
ncbi:hypothetical protein [Clostridium butyricum]|uniref:hypothetical protein n=1 Tax=Clostridium butyricum TaxID=1492 RepID=UPI0018AC7570|nr:hypothetical protein [Clostridium butyricum]MDB2156914.1 hypothetical protein [Clostridium butyricum]